MPYSWWPNFLVESLWHLADQPAFLALLALFVDRLWPRRRAGPPPGFKARILSLAGRLDRPHRGSATRRFRGALLWFAACLMGIALGLGLHYGFALARTLHLAHTLHMERIAQVLFLAWAVAYRPARATARRAVIGLKDMVSNGRSVEARQVAKIASARLAVRFANGPLGITILFLLFGWPGLLAGRFTQLCAASITARDGQGPFDQAVADWSGRLAAVPAWFAAALVGRPNGRIASGYGNLTDAVAALPAIARVEDDPPARVARTRRAVEQGWWLWCLILVLGGTAAEFWSPFA